MTDQANPILTPIDDKAAAELVDAYNQLLKVGLAATHDMQLPADLVAELDDNILRLAVDGASLDDQTVLLAEMKRRGLTI